MIIPRAQARIFMAGDVRQDGTLDFNTIHDGTWWPHDGGDSLEWMRTWYPDFAGLYAQALAVQGEGRAPICVF